MTSQGTERRILVVDDEPDITLTLEAGLKTVGLFDVDTFNDPESVLKSLEFELYYEALKKDFPDLDVGCFIKKPISIEALAVKLRELA